MQSRAIRNVCYALIVALLSTVAPMPFATPASADLMPHYSVGVVDFINESGVQGDLLARLATDAVVVEMSKTDRYDVAITRTKIKEEMTALDLRSPLNRKGLMRLGESLSADAMLEGSIKTVQLSGSGATRRASVTLAMQMIDQASGEVVNGAVQTGSSSARVGYSADDDALIVEAINDAAFMAVKTMVDYVIPEATVLMNIGSDQVMLNMGSRDGIKPGMSMIVLRQKEIIGYIQVRNVDATGSTCKVLKSMRGIQPEDRARAIYDMPAISSSLNSEPAPSGVAKSSGGGKSAMSSIGKFLLGLAIVGGLVAMFNGGTGSEKGPGIGAAGPMEIKVSRTDYGRGGTNVEYQVLRDDFGISTKPVFVRYQPSIDATGGIIDLLPIYGVGGTIPVDYAFISSIPSTIFTATSYQLAREEYGTTHTYQVRVFYGLKSTGGSSGGTDTGDGTTTGATTAGINYYYTPVSNVITATAIEKVQSQELLTPVYGEEITSVDFLQSAGLNFTWSAKPGADVYRIVFIGGSNSTGGEPAPGRTFVITNPTILGDIASMPTSVRDSFVSTYFPAAAPSRYSGATVKWRVDCRHDADTSKEWVIGAESQFTIGVSPENPPSGGGGGSDLPPIPGG